MLENIAQRLSWPLGESRNLNELPGNSRKTPDGISRLSERATRFQPVCAFLIQLHSSFAIASAWAQAPIHDAIDWLPVTDSDRQTNAPQVDKDAGVEALFWRVHVTDEMHGDEVQRVYYQYVRLKIFNEKGTEKAATIEVPPEKGVSIFSLTGRTIKADGSIVELKKDPIFERDVVRAGGLRHMVKSFAMPGVEPGAIVEYRRKEVRSTGQYFITYISMPFQREYPVRQVTYFIKPLPRDRMAENLSMKLMAFNCQPSPLKLENDGFNSLTLEKIPAYQDEPFAPSSPNLQPWALAFYEANKRRKPDEYWDDVGRKEYQSMKAMLKPDNEMKTAARRSDSRSNQRRGQVVRLLRYLRAHLANLWDPGVDEAARNKILEQFQKFHTRTSADVFRSGMGTADEMNSVFASMAMAVGLEARPALVGDRNERAFAPDTANRYFLSNVDMAVKLGDQWRLFDVSSRRLPPDMLSWREQGVFALVSDPKKPIFIQTPVSAPEASLTTRSARLRLSADGAIEGDVDLSLTGLSALDSRDEMEGESAERRQEMIKDRVSQEFPGAEVSDVKVETVENAAQPVKVHDHIKVPHYAERTGKRILFQPLFFQCGAPPRFAAAERRYPIVFHYAWKETDSVLIGLPQGFALDNADKPGNIDFGASGEYRVKMPLHGQSLLVTERELTVGRQGRIVFDSKVYPQLKSVFDQIHRGDNHTSSLKLVEAAQ